MDPKSQSRSWNWPAPVESAHIHIMYSRSIRIKRQISDKRFEMAVLRKKIKLLFRFFIMPIPLPHVISPVSEVSLNVAIYAKYPHNQEVHWYYLGFQKHFHAID